jgi:hypothetical protein
MARRELWASTSGLDARFSRSRICGTSGLRPASRWSGEEAIIRDIHRCLAALVATVALVACGVVGGPARVRTGPADPVPADVMETPDQLLQECLGTEVVARACPRVVPATEDPYRGGSIDFGTPRFAAVDMSSSVPHEDRPSRNRPPRFAHVVIEAGEHRTFLRLAASKEAADMRTEAPAWRGDWESLLRRPRQAPVLLSEPGWGRRDGSLFLFPAYPTGGMLGDHLVFMWDLAGVDYVISLHVWSPIDEAVATLQAMVGSVRRR